MPFYNKRDQDSLGKCLNLGLGQGIDKVSLESLIMPESKEVLTKPTLTGAQQRDAGARGKSQSWNNLGNKTV